MKVPTVAIVGRPNVGKSTIFNKLVGKKIAIIEDTPGVTRDRIYGTVNYKNYKFHLIDTGGIDVSEEDFNNEIIIQANIAIEEADIIEESTHTHHQGEKIVVTISREYGSGGRYVGKLLADLLNVNFYDKELIMLASKDSGLSKKIYWK